MHDLMRACFMHHSASEGKHALTPPQCHARTTARLASPRAAKSSSASALARQGTKCARAQRTQAHRCGACEARTCTGTAERKGHSVSETTTLRQRAGALERRHPRMPALYTVQLSRCAGPTRRPPPFPALQQQTGCQPRSGLAARKQPESPPLRPRRSSARQVLAAAERATNSGAQRPPMLAALAAPDAQAAGRRVSTGNRIRAHTRPCCTASARATQPSAVSSPRACFLRAALARRARRRAPPRRPPRPQPRPRPRLARRRRRLRRRRPATPAAAAGSTAPWPGRARPGAAARRWGHLAPGRPARRARQRPAAPLPAAPHRRGRPPAARCPPAGARHASASPALLASWAAGACMRAVPVCVQDPVAAPVCVQDPAAACAQRHQPFGLQHMGCCFARPRSSAALHLRPIAVVTAGARSRRAAAVHSNTTGISAVHSFPRVSS